MTWFVVGFLLGGTLGGVCACVIGVLLLAELEDVRDELCSERRWRRVYQRQVYREHLQNIARYYTDVEYLN